MKKTCLTFTAFFMIAASSAAAQIEYNVSFPNAVHHEAEITVTVRDLPTGALGMRLSRSSPGRYALHEFGKNVYNVRAVDGNGRSLSIHRPDPYQWDIAGHNGTVTVSYTLFADRGGGTYSQIDESHAHMNMPATFMWAKNMDDREIRAVFHPPTGSNWRAATQLFPTSEAMTFTAPSLQYFLDSPTELSDFMLHEWTVGEDSDPYTIRLAMHHLGTEAEFHHYAETVEAVVAEQIEVFGAPASYDGGTYTFIADYLPWVSGDGMEHRNSTILANTGSLATNALRLLGTVSHEYFHSWNVERIRPSSLEPFDFERANMSRELWFAEGFTSYYTPLFIRRAGVTNNEQFASAMSGRLNTVTTAPGRQFFSAVEMSMQAPFVDAASSIDPNNRSNTFISYYTWGAMIGLNLDLTLRIQFDKTLDDYMRLVWDTHGATEIAYDVSDLQQLLGDFTGSASFASTFFDNFIRGQEIGNYEALLARAGFLVRKREAGQPTLGQARWRFDTRGATITSGTLVGTPLYEAGVDRGAHIISIDGQSFSSVNELTEILRAKSPGERVSIEFENRGRSATTSVALIENPSIEVVTYEAAGMPVTPAMETFRESWLGRRAGRE